MIPPETPEVYLKGLVIDGEDLALAKKESKLGIILGFQGASPLGRNIHLIRVFHRLGVRIIQLTYNEGNPMASGGGP